MATAPVSVQAYKDTKDLIDLYVTNAQFRQTFNYLVHEHQGQATFRYRPLKFYVGVVSQLAPEYKNDVSYKINEERTEQIFHGFHSKNSYREALDHEVIEPRLINREFTQAVQRIDQETNQIGKEQERHSRFSELIDSHSPEPVERAVVALDELPAEPELTSSPHLPNIPAPSFVKNALSKAQIFLADKLANPYITGALVGVLGGLGIGGPVGALVGVVGGPFLANLFFGKKRDQDNNQRFSPLSALGNLNPFSPGGSRGGGLSGNLAKQGAKKLATKLGKQALTQVVEAGLFSNPIFWVVIAVLILLIGLPILIKLIKVNSLLPPYKSITANTTTNSSKSEVIINKSGPQAVNNGQDILYNFSVIYTGSGTADVEVDDTIPNQTIFKEASNGGGNQSGVVKWLFQGVAPNRLNPFTLTITPTSDDIWVVNSARAFVVSSKGGSVSELPNNNDCSGLYPLNNPIGNFGDPSCNFTEQDLYKALKQADSVNADFWFNVVIPCESSYSPNAYNGSAVDEAGAWGLTQMGRGKNGQFDYGDVSWPQQVTNTISYQRMIGGWTYWACANSRW